jgi:hypothetical protein
MCVCILLKSSETFFRASCYFLIASLMADFDAEVNIHVTGDDEVPDDSNLISDAPVADDVPLVGEAQERSDKAMDAIVEVPPATTGAEIIEEKFNQFSKMYKMIGGYDVEAQLVMRERERLQARKVLQKISKDKRNEKRRLNRIKERVNKIKNDALPELMHFMMQNEVRRRDKAAIAKCVAKSQSASKASSSKS